MKRRAPLEGSDLMEITQVEEIIHDYQMALENKRFITAMLIRDDLERAGIAIKETDHGVCYTFKFKHDITRKIS